MPDDRWLRVKQICEAALGIETGGRAQYLRDACAGDEALRSEVESLLAYGDRAEGFLEQAALERAARSFVDEGGSSLVGREAGHYRILRRLGEGGMGEVYLAHDSQLGRKVALKLLPEVYTQDRDRLGRFVREAKATSALNHPNIVTIYEVGEFEGRHFIAAEFIDGRTLRERLAEGDMAPTEALDVAAQAAGALAAAHEAGILHRDIKPENIMLRPDGYVKVLDFGVAKLIEQEQEPETGGREPMHHTAPWQVLGTPGYMSPEQALGRRLDGRSDIFSLGVVLYEMLSGCSPFQGSTPGEAIVRVVNDEAQPLSLHRKGLPDALLQIVEKALAKRPEDRYQAMIELAADLKGLRLDLELRARPDSTADENAIRKAPARKEGARRRTGRRNSWIAVLSSAALLGVLIYGTWIRDTQPALSFAARDWMLIADTDNQTGEPLFDRSLHTALTVSLEQSPYANVLPRARLEEALRRMGKDPAERVTEAVAREVCLRESVRVLLACSIHRFGEQYQLVARIVDPSSGASLRSFEVRAGEQSGILKALDSLCTQVRRGLGESRNSIAGNSKDLPAVTTPSLQALRQYAEGSEIWRKGKYAEAVRLWESALELDPDFAKAHAALGTAFTSFVYNDTARGREHLEQALKLSDRTTDRERLSIQIAFEHGASHFEEAAALYRIYLEKYPDDTPIRFNFANLLMRNDRPAEAIDQYRELIRVNPRDASALINTASAYGNMGKIDQSLEQYDAAFKLEPSWITKSNLNHEYGFSLVRSGRLEDARQVFDRGLNSPIQNIARRSMGLFLMFQGRFREAESLLRDAALQNQAESQKPSEARNRLFLSILYEGRGERQKQVAELERAASILEPDGLFWLRARIGAALARAGALRQAGRLLDALRQRVVPKNAGDSSEFHRFEGELALANGDLKQAEERMLLSDSERRNDFTTESLGHFYRKAGRLEEAEKCYASLIDMRIAIGQETQQSWLEAHEQLARLQLRRGESGRARELLKFVSELWKDADPEIPLLLAVKRLSDSL